MTALVVRRLLIDLQTPFARHWCGGDAFRTAFFNALSMSFPVGEQFFMDAVRAGHQALPAQERTRFADEVRGFVGQEATHRHIHALFNGHLARQGLVNTWADRARQRLQRFAGADLRHPLAVTAAHEHFTAVLAEWMLSHPEVLGNTEPRLVTLWLWHSAEEAEHKSTAYDIYHALGGNHAWRVTWFKRITVMFLLDLLRQTLRNLRDDGSLWRPSTWASGARLLLGRHGLLRKMWGPWRAYVQHGFHPDQHGSDLSVRWLTEHANDYTPVGGAR